MSIGAFSLDRRVCLVLVALLSTGAIGGCDRQTAGGAGTVTESNVGKKIEEARTPGDHQELANYYESRANAARREAVQGRELRGQYERRWRSDRQGERAGRHFEDLAEDHEQTESHYRAMADWHREMARHGEHAASSEE